MPILFPIATAGLLINYLSERLRMAYSYQKPPMYDSTLSQSTLDLLTYAPILYLIMAAWLFSNQQVFKNVIPEIAGNYLYPLNNHQFSDLID